MTDSTAIQNFIDQSEIMQSVARYGRAVDWLDIASMKGCFADDATISFGEMEIPASAFCDFWAGLGGGFKARHHMLGMPTIALHGSGKAFVEVPAVVYGTKADEGVRLRDFMECNRYLFDMVRDGDGWKIASAKVFITWSQGAPTSTGLESGGPLDHDVTVANPSFVAL